MGQCQSCLPCDNKVAEVSLSETDWKKFDSIQRVEVVQSSAEFVSQVQTQVKEEQITDFTFETHKPSASYAELLDLDAEELNSTKYEESIKLLKKLGYLIVRDNVSDQIVKLPYSDQPYRISELQSVYVGQWKFGKPFGKGILYFDDGQVYEGYQESGIAQGTGRKIFQDQSYYIGSFVGGQVQGQGKLVKANGFQYEGDWESNLPHGQGKEVWPNQTRYQGQYKDGRKCGRGRFVWPIKKDSIIQESYDGFFLNDIFNGEGRYEWSDGRTYEGQWREGKMNGKGVFTWHDGRKYEGQYLSDLKHGEGTFTWPDGKSWEGQWRLGKMDGIGTITLPNGKTYTGEWKDGKRLKWVKDLTSRSMVSNQSIKMSINEERFQKVLDYQVSENTSVINPQQKLPAFN